MSIGQQLAGSPLKYTEVTEEVGPPIEGSGTGGH